MTPDERDLISGLFARLKSADMPDKDRDAEELIRRSVAEFPPASYLLTQTVLVQEQALKSAEGRIAQLEREAAERKPEPSNSGSFLGRLRRPWETPAQPAPQPQYAPQPYNASPPAAAGGGFLQSALSTAAGVAGGAMLFSGIERMLGHSPGPFGGYAGFGGSPWGGSAGAPAENVVVNNYYGDADTPATHETGYEPADRQSDVGYSDASYQDDGGDLGGGDFGGGDTYDV